MPGTAYCRADAAHINIKRAARQHLRRAARCCCQQHMPSRRMDGHGRLERTGSGANSRTLPCTISDFRYAQACCGAAGIRARRGPWRMARSATDISCARRGLVSAASAFLCAVTWRRPGSAASFPALLPRVARAGAGIRLLRMYALAASATCLGIRRA